MRKRPLAHLADATLLANFEALLARDRKTTVELLEHIIEIDTRKLWDPAGYSSMYRFCVGRYHMSEDVAYKRIRVARAACRHPDILDRLADGRLHLAGVVELVPYLRAAGATELLQAAEHKTRKEIQLVLAERFPRPDLPTRVVPLVAMPNTSPQLAPGPVASIADATLAPPETSAASELPQPVFAVEPRSTVTPLAPQRFGFQTTLSEEAVDLLREIHELLGHPTPTSHASDVVLDALRHYARLVRRQKFGATDAPRPGRKRNPDSRQVPADVKRAVWNRDGGRCSFVSDAGHRCEERSGLEYDHIVPYARGGDSTVSNVRLLCPAHNQYEADQTYGAEFMERKRKRA